MNHSFLSMLLLAFLCLSTLCKANTEHSNHSISDNCAFIVDGCTDAAACNYDPTATEGDGSCDYGITDCPEPCNALLGCMEMIACNYDPDANCANGSCVYGNSNCPDDCDVIYGCFNPQACNYDPTATCDFDVECEFPEEGYDCEGNPIEEGGCTNPTSCNYNPDALYDNGTCDNGGAIGCPDPCNALLGCTDPLACNFDIDATCDNSSCDYNCGCCSDPIACNYNPGCNLETGNCFYGEIDCPEPCNVIYGCTDPTACNFDAVATCEDGSCYFGNTSCPEPCNTILGCTDPMACNFVANANCDNGSCDFGNTSCPEPCDVILGCTDPMACNFVADATCDDGSCDYGATDCPDPCNAILGCTSPIACNYEPEANCDNGSCDQAFSTDCPEPCNVIAGCTDPLACNYDPEANCDYNDFCDYACPGCTEPEACNYNPEATEDGSCYFDCPGCTDPAACNYNADATEDNGSCDFGNFDCPIPCNVIYGCMDPLSPYYNPEANCNDSTNDSCEEFDEGCTDPIACNYDATSNVDDGSCDYGDSNCLDQCIQIFGCTEPTSCNFNPEATCNDGSCEYISPEACADPCNDIEGCTDPAACNYATGATCNNGTCEYSGCNGCLDAAACNYNPEANQDDGSCDYGIATCADPCSNETGCTNPSACNYDNNADCDDGSCDLTCIYGCTDPEADNFNPLANTDDGSCLILLQCGGPFYDSGGPGWYPSTPASNYGNDEDKVYIACPEIDGDKVIVEFTNFATYPYGDNDRLTIYNGENTGAPIIQTPDNKNYWTWFHNIGSADPVAEGPFEGNNPSGCLTFRFQSNRIGTTRGWEAIVNCAPFEGTFADITSNAEILEFGPVPPSNTSLRYLSLKNDGDFMLNISEIEFYPANAAFSVNNSPFTIEANSEVILPVSFTPEEDILYESQLTLKGDWQNIVVQLRGTGQFPEIINSLEQIDTAIEISPNPSNGFFMLKYDGNFNAKKNILKIYSSDGKMIYEENLNSNSQQLNLSQYPKGIYFAHLLIDDHRISRKLILN